jgi:lipid-binding SYLF domain-containing protein
MQSANRTPATVLTLALLMAAAVGCAGAPETRPEQASLEARADATLVAMRTDDPSLGRVLDGAAGYVVFPRVREAAFIVGGVRGRGVVYEAGRPIGYATVTGGSVGAQAGGQGFSQLLILESDRALDRLKADNFDLTADASATLVRSGAAASARFEGGVAVLVHDPAGAMVQASIGGQRIEFTPIG